MMYLNTIGSAGMRDLPANMDKIAMINPEMAIQFFTPMLESAQRAFSSTKPQQLSPHDLPVFAKMGASIINGCLVKDSIEGKEPEYNQDKLALGANILPIIYNALHVREEYNDDAHPVIESTENFIAACRSVGTINSLKYEFKALQAYRGAAYRKDKVVDKMFSVPETIAEMQSAEGVSEALKIYGEMDKDHNFSSQYRSRIAEGQSNTMQLFMGNFGKIQETVKPMAGPKI